MNLEPNITLSQGNLSDYCHRIMPYITKRGKIISCVENLKVLLDIVGIRVRYNVIKKNMEIMIPETSFSIDNESICSLAWIISKIKQIEMDSSNYREYLSLLADNNQYNPVLTWVTSLKWDGRTRLSDLYATIKAVDEKSKEAFIFRWMIGAIALACSPSGIDSNGILVLQGEQGLGKTWWFRKLVPQELNLTRADANINPHDKDSVNQAVSNWLVELGELDATFSRSEIAALKSFITRDFDIYRKPYMPEDSKFPRRTAFMASVNPVQYLTDETGNRRYWTIQCLHVDSYHDIDMQQLWAEIYEKWMGGVNHMLTNEEKEMVKKNNEDHVALDPIQEILSVKYDWETEKSEINGWRWVTATHVLQEINWPRLGKADLKTCARVVRQFSGLEGRRSSKGRELFVPAKLTEDVY